MVTLREPCEPYFNFIKPQPPQKFNIEYDSLSLPYIPYSEREDVNEGGLTLPQLIEYCKQKDIDPNEVRIEKIDGDYDFDITITYKHKKELHPHIYKCKVEEYQKDLQKYEEDLANYNKELKQYLVDIKNYLIDLSNQEKPKNRNYLCYLLELKEKYSLHYLEIDIQNQIIKVS